MSAFARRRIYHLFFYINQDYSRNNIQLLRVFKVYITINSSRKITTGRTDAYRPEYMKVSMTVSSQCDCSRELKVRAKMAFTSGTGTSRASS